MESRETGLGTVRPLHADDEAQERLLWRQFQEAASPEAFYAGWLAIQCRTVENVEAGLLLTRSRRTGKYTAAARWPAHRNIGAHVQAAAEQVLQKRQALALELNPEGEGAQSGPRTVIAVGAMYGAALTFAGPMQVALLTLRPIQAAPWIAGLLFGISSAAVFIAATWIGYRRFVRSIVESSAPPAWEVPEGAAAS